MYLRRCVGRSRVWSAILGGFLLLGAGADSSDRVGSLASFVVQGSDYAAALSAVTQAHGRVTHTLPIINAVAADLSATQLEALRHDPHLAITPNRLARVSGTPTQSVDPYVAER